MSQKPQAVQIDVRKYNADRTLFVAEGKVIARGTERTTVGSLFVVVVQEPKMSH